MRQLLDTATLPHHAVAVLADAKADARKQATAKSGLARAVFPEACFLDLTVALADRGEDLA